MIEADLGSSAVSGSVCAGVREAHPLSEQDVSAATGTPRTAISDIARGRRRVDSLALKDFAGLCCRPVRYFLVDLPDAGPDDHDLDIRYRAFAALTSDDQHAVLSYAALLTHQADRRRGCTRRAAGPSPLPAEVLLATDLVTDADQVRAARSELRAHGTTVARGSRR